MVFPQIFHGNSDGEDYLWAFLRKNLPDNWVSFHNANIAFLQPDIILLVPGRGVLILENKSYRARNITKVEMNRIYTKNNPVDSSPFQQVREYVKDFKIVLNDVGIDNIHVIPCVIYPYISKEEYVLHGLSAISNISLTLLKEDIASRDRFLTKIDDIFDFAYQHNHNPKIENGGFTTQLFSTVGNIILPDFHSAVPAEVPATEDYPAVKDRPDVYSRLIYSKTGNEFTEERIEALFKEWRSGTKLQLYTIPEAANHLIESFNQRIQLSSIAEAFSVNDGMSFRLEIAAVNSNNSGFEIINGENYFDYNDLLIWLDSSTSFNYSQYKMEHASPKNVIVKAGAGTGKTFSLISRINYLLWLDDVQPEEFANYLAMITFTNDSADTMENKLVDNFLNLYKLTKNPKYFRFIESVDDVHISTIDSLCRALISKYSIKLGLGKDFAITSSTYRREQLLHKNLGEYFSANPDIEANISTKMSLYHFEKRLNGLFDRFDNKNVDLSAMSLDFGCGDMCLPDGILTVLTQTQNQFCEELREKNSVFLGDLIKKLNILTSKLSKDELNDGQIKYLFIDEFQDTDDIQISLIKSFKQLIGFQFFAVGDVKQSIYRFRGAESAAFNVLKEGYLEDDIEEISLQKNYRTDITLLGKMNRIFSVMNNHDDIDYRDNDVLVATQDFNVTIPFKMHHYYGAQPGAEELAGLIKQCVQDLPETNKKDSPKVAILVRYNSQISQIVDICHKHQIAVSTDSGGELFSADPTIDLYKLVMALRYNHDPLYLYNLYTTSYIRSPLPKIKLYNTTASARVQGFLDAPPIDGWNSYVERIKAEPVLHVLQDIIDKAKPWDNFARLTSDSIADEFDYNRNYYLSNLNQVFESILVRANSEYLTINKLSDYLETMIVTRQKEKEREQFGVYGDASKLICTTVHKSKGLEYDTVIIPFTSFDISGSREKGDTDVIFADNKVGYRLSKNKVSFYRNDFYDDFKKDENLDRRKEEMRILYVAMTRAKRMLHCYIPQKLSANSINWAVRINEGATV